MIKTIVTDRVALSRPCQPVLKPDIGIIEDMRDTLATKKGWGISANQIGIDARISIVKLPKEINPEEKEYILINAKMIEKAKPIKIKEGCLSFPGLTVETKRYGFIVIEYYDENMKLNTGIFSDYEAIAVQHELQHQHGITIFQNKWVAR